MRYISINNVKPYEIAATDVFDSSGRLMVGSGAPLTESIIERLKQFGFQGVYIGDPISDDIVIPPTISPELRKMAKECIKSLNVKQSVPVAYSIMEEIMQKQIVSLDMNDIRAFDEYTYAHSVNVAVLCCVMGLAMKLGQEDLFHLVNAAILHDFGKMKIPEEVVNKAGRLTGEEYELIKTHAQKSYDIIKDSDDIAEEVKQAVLMHHENEDGSGYPRGLTGSEMPMIAKILHTADVYDALISSRPYKKGYAPWEAAEYLMGGCGISFDKRIVEAFVKQVPLYPIGSEVRLSTGDNCLVIANKGSNNLRPVVRRISDSYTIDLSLRENMTIGISSADSTYLKENEETRKEMIDATKQKRIVIVDDMKTNLQMLRDILEPEFKVIPFKTGIQTMQFLDKHLEPDLFVLDIDMPMMTGTELAKLINEKYKNKVPILFVSAITDKKTVLLCRELRASGYIARPYNPIYVLSEVKRIIEGRVSY